MVAFLLWFMAWMIYGQFVLYMLVAVFGIYPLVYLTNVDLYIRICFGKGGMHTLGSDGWQEQ
jgi:hypothetical protein